MVGDTRGWLEEDERKWRWGATSFLNYLEIIPSTRLYIKYELGTGMEHTVLSVIQAYTSEDVGIVLRQWP